MPKDPSNLFLSKMTMGRSQDGGGTGRGDHFLFYKFIERTTEQSEQSEQSLQNNF